MAPSTIRQPHRPYYAVGGCYRLQEGPTDSTTDSDYSSSESSSFSESDSYDDSDSDDDSRSESESDCTDDSIACLDDLLEPEDSDLDSNDSSALNTRRRTRQRPSASLNARRMADHYDPISNRLNRLSLGNESRSRGYHAGSRATPSPRRAQEGYYATLGRNYRVQESFSRATPSPRRAQEGYYATLGRNYRVQKSCTDYDSDSDDDSRSESESDCTAGSIACLDDLLEPEDSDLDSNDSSALNTRRRTRQRPSASLNALRMADHYDPISNRLNRLSLGNESRSRGYHAGSRATPSPRRAQEGYYATLGRNYRVQESFSRATPSPRRAQEGYYATLGRNYRVQKSCTDYDSDSDDDSRSESESDCTDDSIACLDDLLEPEDSDLDSNDSSALNTRRRTRQRPSASLNARRM